MFFFIFIYILAIISKQTAEQLNLPFFSLRFFSLNRRRNSYLSKSPTLYSYLLVVLLIPIQLLWKVLTWLLTSILVWYSFLLTWWKRLLLLRERDSFSYMSDVVNWKWEYNYGILYWANEKLRLGLLNLVIVG